MWTIDNVKNVVHCDKSHFKEKKKKLPSIKGEVGRKFARNYNLLLPIVSGGKSWSVVRNSKKIELGAAAFLARFGLGLG